MIHWEENNVFIPGVTFHLIKFNTHHPEECCVSQGLVLIDGGQNAENQTGQNYEKPARNKADHILVLIKVS